MKDKFYVTTAIDYPNAEPHVGHAYQKVIADIIYRWNLLLGKNAYFLTGTDEHGKKIQESAQKEGKKPKEFVDEMANKFKDAWNLLEVQPNRFIRTTDKDHEKIVSKMIEISEKNGDIYKGTYEGLYCVGCEAYYTEKELVDGKCPLHNRPVEKLKEESYFFKLSKYQKFLLDLYKKNPEFLQPKERRNEMINRVKEGLRDLSISRTSFDWGIPFPTDKKHVIYVWFDALFNYYSGAGKNHEYWPADYHLLGRDNAWFHSVYWPAFLKSVGLPLPKTVFIHGFLTFNGQKISKSLGNAISPKVLVEKYGADSIRYYFSRNFVFGEDGDFSENTLVERHNNELANKLGNLVSRVSTLAEKYGLDDKVKSKLSSKDTVKKFKIHLENLEFDKALNEVFAFIDKCNEYIQEKKPWETQDKKVLYELANAIKDFTILLSPFMPGTCKKIAETFGFEISIKQLDSQLKITKIKKSEILFRKIEIKEEPKMETKEEPKKTENKISYDDFAKLEFKVGKILKVEDHPKADKLLVLTVDLGEDKPRTIVAGLKKFYTKENLVGKKAVFVANLAPANLRGVESNGMILAAGNADDSEVYILTPEKDIKEGSKIK
jgi:methionyl-tRNA synthetase